MSRGALDGYPLVDYVGFLHAVVLDLADRVEMLASSIARAGHSQ